MNQLMGAKNNELNYINNNNFPSLKIKFLCDISTQSFNFYEEGNSFIIFKSLNNISYIAFATNNSIILYNLNQQQIENEIKKPHEYFIKSFKHCIYNNKDIIMTVCPSDNNIKLWDITNWEILVNIRNVNTKNLLLSACFLNFNNQQYILSSNVDLERKENAEPIKVFDFLGKKIKEISNSNEHTIFIDTYYDKNKSKNYIITGNINFVNSYDYENNKLYHKYNSNYYNVFGEHANCVIYDNENKIKMIESCNNAIYILIWDFHEGILLNIIKHLGVYSFCLFNENYLFVGGMDGNIKLVELKNGNSITICKGHESRICYIQKFMHPNYGECLISQGWFSEPIKLWAINNK